MLVNGHAAALQSVFHWVGGRLHQIYGACGWGRVGWTSQSKDVLIEKHWGSITDKSVRCPPVSSLLGSVDGKSDAGAEEELHSSGLAP
jgi:hypothetical protein